MPDASRTPAQQRLIEYFREIEDPHLMELVAELVAIKQQHMHNTNRPMQKYKDKIDAYASLKEEG